MADDFTLKWDAQNQQLFGEDPATGNRVAVPFETVNAGSVNTGSINNVTTPEKYGAVGDGSVDDTAAIQSALDEAEGGGVVSFPSDEYRVTYSLQYGTKTKVIAPGVKFNWEPSNADAVFMAPKSYDKSTTVKDCVIEGFEINPVDPTKGNGVGAPHAENITFRDLSTDSLYWHLIDFSGGRNLKASGCKAVNNTSAAYQLDNLTASGGFKIELSDGTVENANNDGSTISNAILENNIAIDCQAGIHLHRNRGENLQIINNIVRDCDTGIFSDPNKYYDVVIEGNQFINCDTVYDFPGDYINLHISGNVARDYNSLFPSTPSRLATANANRPRLSQVWAGTAYGPEDTPGATYYYPFDEDQGASEATDIVNLGFDATPQGSPTFGATGKSGNAVDVSGSGNYLETGRWEIEKTARSFSGWVYLDQSTFDGTRHTIMENSGGFGFGFLEVNENQKLLGGGPNNAIDTADFPLQQWVHVGFAWEENDEIKLYKNGSVVGSDSVGSVSGITGDPDHFGTYRNADGRYFDGKIDEFISWEEKLSENQMNSIYNVLS